MQKKFFMPMIMGLQACGAGSAGDAMVNEAIIAERSKPSKASQSLYFQTVDELPICDDESKHSLAYVQSEQSFKTCREGAWQTVEIQGPAGKKSLIAVNSEKADEFCPVGGEVLATGIDDDDDGILAEEEVDDRTMICHGQAGEKGEKGDQGYPGADGLDGVDGVQGPAGQDGSSGLSIVKIYDLSSQITDVCSRWSNVLCFLRGGEVIEYSNGMTEFSGTLAYLTDFTITGSGVDPEQLDTDTFMVNANGVALSANSFVFVSFLKIARTGSDVDRQLWLAYDAALKTAELWYDSNNNGQLDLLTDERIETLTKTLLYSTN